MVYSTRYDKNADRQISDRADRPPPDILVPGAWSSTSIRNSTIPRSGGCRFRKTSGRTRISRSTICSLKIRNRNTSLMFRSRISCRRFRRTDPPFAGRRDFRQGQIRRLSPAQSLAELTRSVAFLVAAVCGNRKAFAQMQLGLQKRRPVRAPFSSTTDCRPSARYFAAPVAGAAPLAAGWVASSFLRASSARFCSSSCSFFWFSSNTFGSVGGPS